MTDKDCTEMQLLVQADVDGELDVAGSARVAAHIAACADCASLQQDLIKLSAKLRREWPKSEASPALRAAIAPKPPLGRRWQRAAFPFGAGLAIAASLAFLFLPAQPDPARELVSSHIRALQPGHLTDVLSSDQHTVKPWFDGRIDFAPPVRDFAQNGFPLVGARLDSIGGRTVAALVYRHEKHEIDLFIWPGRPSAPVTAKTALGYEVASWAAGGMEFRAVSDLNATDLAAFAALWTKTPPP